MLPVGLYMNPTMLQEVQRVNPKNTWIYYTMLPVRLSLVPKPMDESNAETMLPKCQSVINYILWYMYIGSTMHMRSHFQLIFSWFSGVWGRTLVTVLDDQGLNCAVGYGAERDGRTLVI